MPFKDKNKLKAYQREWYCTTKDAEKARDLHLRTTYGLDSEGYHKLSEKQNHVCAICGNAETATYRGKVKKLAVDHCHQKGAIRGLLCADCNRGIGLFKDNPELLFSAAAYLGGE
ncbi:hypothetical protein G3O90_004542 [Salmonella enterica]|nr:hypothetical protein [Salmonella enterica]ELO6840404.1 endonuclease VII domain-containing protein [Salmonella enterica]